MDYEKAFDSVQTQAILTSLQEQGIEDVYIEILKDIYTEKLSDSTSAQRDTTKNHGRLGGIRQTPGYLQKQPCHLPEETGVQLLCAASYDIWCRDLDTDQQAQNKLAAAQTKMERSMLNITYKDRKTNIWVRERTKVIDIIHTVRKMKCPGQGISTASKTTDEHRVSPLGDHMTRKDDKGDQPSGGETTWTNTGATRYDRGKHKTG